MNPGGTNEQFARLHLAHAQIILHPDNRSIFDELSAAHGDVMVTDDIEVELQIRRNRRDAVAESRIPTFSPTPLTTHESVCLRRQRQAPREVRAMGWIFLGIIVLAVFFFTSIYNRLVSGRNAYKNAFAQIDVQLTRRYDLIPNLVETAKGYMKHERETLEAVIAARNAAVSGLRNAASNPGSPSAVQELAGADNTLTASLGRLFALAEAYPDLKANQNMMQLSEELTSTENKVAFARQAYNDAVMGYNNSREVFPNSILANSFGFLAAQLLEIESPEKRVVPKVSF